MIETPVGTDLPEAARSASPRPGPERGPSARAYLLMVLGLYAFDQGDAAWTQTIIEALALTGFEDKAARKALARTAEAGLLAARRDGRRTRWQLTPAGHDYLRTAKARLFAPGPDADWNGDWLILLASVPENHRNLRHRLRTSLGWAGFGSLGPGAWISPHPTHAREARHILDTLGDPIHGTLMHARLDDPDERHRLVAQAWDIPDLDQQYRAFLDHFEPVSPRSPGEALAQLSHLFYQWRRLLLVDPGLPPALLPPDWSGEHARRLLLNRHTTWHPTAITWWQDQENRK
ncbi:MAG TPA: PaaX family transcriptional regulator C-terminal domain-containing protein [Actinophytocola sp.]|uniref:PaaX family transcriptional regulator n=1 Tax=Actinophytocola sp. TaxID=1872138 RepID=UPI002DBEE2AB|nr:PaaX family transcriptional regulator C-terminal domain-containing protein [Actinophytocola sp.]HEU5473447.1 PaaX family transcriptional regulator C-terminal domain-containing protein [Actinophytocola sp.]